MVKFMNRKHIKIILVLFVTIQFLMVLFLNAYQTSDSVLYLNFAFNSIKAGKIYPSIQDLYSNSICAPGYVNYLIIILNLFGSNIRAILFLNIILNLIILYEIYTIAKYYINDNAAKISLIIFCLYISNYGAVFYSTTELLYCVLAYGSICIFLKANKKIFNSFIAGILIALANWIRPLTIPFILTVILIALFYKYNIKSVGLYFLGIVTTLTLIGFISYQSIGRVEVQSVTSGINLLMGANDHADGSYDPNIIEKGNAGYIKNIEKYTYKQRDKIWRDRAIKWIIRNPIKYIKLFPKKLFYMYALDTHFLSPISGKGQYYKIDKGFIKGLFNISNYIRTFKNDKNKFLLYIAVLVNQLYYFLILVFSFIGVVNLIKDRNIFSVIALTIILVGTGMTIIVVGGGRYHYPYMAIMIILAAYFVDKLLCNKFNNKFV